MRLSFIIVFLAIFTTFAWAFPKKDITLIVPAAVGGTTDTLARTLAQEVSPILGVNVGVRNVAGAGNADGLTLVRRAKPNGYTLVLAPADVVTLPLMGRVGWTTGDFQPILGVIRMPAALVVRSDGKFAAAEDFINYAQEINRNLDVATSAMTGVWFMSAMMFAETAEIKLNLRQYQSSSVILNALRSKETDAAILGYDRFMSDDFRVLCVMSDEFSGHDVRTCKEVGVNVNVGTWWVVMAPPKIKAKELNTLRVAFEDAFYSDRFQDFSARHGFVMEFFPPDKLPDFLNAQADIFTPMLKKNYFLVR